MCSIPTGKACAGPSLRPHEHMLAWMPSILLVFMALSSTEPSSYTWMYPAFAKAIYPENKALLVFVA